ncbi:hypothetical protein CYMTET_54279 [Cymbomonas tetramitiformis]|uniref:AB hydrolase-1 domain-containing protein n=1 Tax=Cymbomonas tetramitiformis TaxID=36881 RepID=A0AAE0BFI3_9CHLO|nr:hypothetical protein CYMTET_54279 [Cymbomonas tetramitiformis]
MHDAVEAETNPLTRLHLDGYTTFHLRLPTLVSEASDKLLCVCCFPQSLHERAFVGKHVEPEDLARLLEADRERPLAVYVHGNAESVHSSLAARNFVNRHLNAIYLSFEWQGYGTSISLPPRFDAQSERCRCVLRFLLQREAGVVRNPILLVGYSLGCAVLLDAIKKERIASAARSSSCRAPFGTVLLAPFLSAASLMVSPPVMTDVVTHLFPPMNNADAVLHLRTDVFVVHGTKDKTIPHRHSFRLVQSFRSSAGNMPYRSRLLIFPNATHSDLLVGSNISHLSLHVREFFRKRMREYGMRVETFPRRMSETPTAKATSVLAI